jgi:hypothetical protein
VQASGAKGNGDVMVQRIVHEVGGGTAFPVLTKTNYSDWALLMRVKLKAWGLWVAIDKGDVDSQEDMMALDALVLMVPPEILATMADKKMAKEAWDAITTMRVGDDRVKRAAAQQLHSQFDHAPFGESESVEDFVLRLKGMVATLATLGEIVPDNVVVGKILRCVLQRLKQIVLTIVTLLDVRFLTVVNLPGRLKVAEEEFEESLATLQQDSKLYLTEEEWDVCRVRRESEEQNSGASSGSSSNGCRGGGDRGCGRGHGCGHGSGYRGL